MMAARLLQAWREDILLRLAAGMFLAVALSSAVYTTYATHTLRAEAEQQLHERAERLALMTAQALARPLFDINGAAINSAVDAMQATREVLMLRVHSYTGERVAGFGPARIDGAGAIAVRRDVVFRDGQRSYPVGTLEMALSRYEVEQDLRRQISHTIVANLLLALAIVVSILLVGRKVARQFTEAQRALERLTWGETDIVLSGQGRPDQIGKLSDAVASFRDTLTRLRQVEAELRELNRGLEHRIGERTAELTQTMRLVRDSQQKLQSIVDTALDAVVRMDVQGRIVGWNSQAEAIFGWRRSEALGQPLETTIIPPRYREGHRRGMQRYIASGQGAVLDTRVELHALHRDGHEFPIELAITRIRLDSEEHYEFCAFIRDISERREREGKLLAANEMAEAANVAKSEFLANMSHEIRTPMSAIIGMAYLALRTDLSPKQHDYVSKIHRAALSLLGIINDILDFSKIEAGRLEVEQVPFFLDDVLSNVASVTGQRAADKQLEYLFHVPPSIPRNLVGDPLRLGQVLINLVNNAVKFTPAGELELSVTRLPDRAALPGKAALRFAVRDTGIGMSAQQMGKLFQAFSQANGSTTRQFGGTGLGLSISQQLVGLMGGVIRVASAPGQGATFEFDLEFALSGQAQRAAVAPAALNGARMLLVDDSPIALQILEEAMQALPVRLASCASGAAALAAIAAADAAGDPFRLVLCDWQMPGMDGIAVARRVRADTTLRQPPGVVLVTAFGREEVQREAEAAGVIGFLFKPIGQSALVDTLVSLVAPPRVPAAGAPCGAPVAEPQGGRDAGHAAAGDAARDAAGCAARVLLVEDHAVNQQIGAELLGALGIRVDIACNGREALERLREQGAEAYAVVLMDLEMPELDGHEATRLLRREPAFDALPIVAMTAHALADVRERCLAEGMQDYITKPIDPERLHAVLSRWLGQTRMPPASTAPPTLRGRDGAKAAAGLPRLPGVDTARGVRHVAGNARLYLHLLERYRQTQRHAVAEIRAELARGDAAQARIRAHTLRGVAGNIGACAVEAAAAALEAALALDAADTAWPAGLPGLLGMLDAVQDEAMAGLDAHFGQAAGCAFPAGTADGNGGGAAVAPMEALARLQTLLAEFSGDSNDYFDSVRTALAALLTPAALERLAGHMAQYEFEAARTILAAAQELDPA